MCVVPRARCTPAQHVGAIAGQRSSATASARVTQRSQRSSPKVVPSTPSGSSSGPSATAPSAPSTLSSAPVPAVPFAPTSAPVGSAVTPETLSSASAATVALGLNMLPSLGDGGNVVFSPDSIETALAMVGTGAAGATATQMASALGLSSPSNFASVGTLQSTLANEQAAAGAGNPQAPMLRIADGLFLQQGVALQSGFLSTLSQSFGATPQSVDFTTPAATQTVNEWVDQQTEGLIPKIVEQFPPETELVLANALYLKAEWRSPFEPGETRPATFTAPGGPETVPFMHRAEQLDYAESSEYTAVQIPYAASPLALLVVMPSPGTSVDTLEQQLDEPTLASLVGSLTPTRLNLSLPSFQIALPSTSIIPQLQALGMTDAFEPGLAEFPKITAGGPPLFISVVQHAADFAVNEQGTIAAAVTAVGAQPVDAEMPPQVSFDADRPFLFFLRDTDTGALLFAGRLTDAQAAGTSP